MSTAYHPQTDGQTERANRTLEEMLRSLVNFQQTDWDDHLAVAELAINNAQQASTGFSPFHLNYGQEVQLPLDHGHCRSSSVEQPGGRRAHSSTQVRPRSAQHQLRSCAAAPVALRRSTSSRRHLRRG